MPKRTDEEWQKILDEHEEADPTDDRTSFTLTEAARIKMLKEAVDSVIGPKIAGVPFLITRRQIQAIFDLPMVSAQRFIKRYLVPMGAVVMVGTKYLVQPWGIWRLLNPDGRCVYCGRGGTSECELTPKLSTMPLDKREKEHFEKYKRTKMPKYRTEPERK